MPRKRLNDDHEKFCVEYVKDQNGTQAYLRTYPGVSEKAAGVCASKLLKKDSIQEKIAQLKKPSLKKAMVTQDRVIQELANIAFGHLGLVCVQDKEGNLTLKQFDAMENGQIGTLQAVKQTKSYDRDGNLLSTNHNFNMHDKLKALELLSKHLGMLDGSGAEKHNKDHAESRLRGAIGRVAARLRGRGNRTE